MPTIHPCSERNCFNTVGGCFCSPGSLLESCCEIYSPDDAIAVVSADGELLFDNATHRELFKIPDKIVETRDWSLIYEHGIAVQDIDVAVARLSKPIIESSVETITCTMKFRTIANRFRHTTYPVLIGGKLARLWHCEELTIDKLISRLALSSGLACR